MKVIDNFIPVEYQNGLEALMLSDAFNWFYLPSTVNPSYGGCVVDGNTVEAPQLVHIFCLDNKINSDYYGFLSTLIDTLRLQNGIKTDNVCRVKANMVFKDPTTPKHCYRTPHKDYEGVAKCTAVIYYVNDADGDTLFFDSDKNITHSVTPKKGRAVLFDAKALHAGQPPRNSAVRVVINFNFIEEVTNDTRNR